MHRFQKVSPGPHCCDWSGFASDAPLYMRHELYPDDEPTGAHQHTDFHALYMVRSGRGVHVIDGRAYGMSRGDVYLLPPAATHGYHSQHALEIDAFYFLPSILRPNEVDALHESSGFWRLWIGNASSPDHRLHLTPQRFALAGEMVAELHAEAASPSSAARALLGPLFFRLLMRLSRWHDERPEPLKPPTTAATAPDINAQRAIAEAVAWCEAHYAEPLRVPQLAARAFLTPGHFSELFKRETGHPPAAYIRKLRLEHAQTLLRSSTLNAEQIAHTCGLRDAAHLARAFRRDLGLTPTQHRKSHHASLH